MIRRIFLLVFVWIFLWAMPFVPSTELKVVQKSLPWSLDSAFEATAAMLFWPAVWLVINEEIKRCSREKYGS
jgi:hypothetical protein